MVNADVELIADVPGVVTFDRTDGVLKAIGSGVAKVKLRDRPTGVESDTISVESVVCTGVDVVPPAAPMLKGQRISRDLVPYGGRPPD